MDRWQHARCRGPWWVVASGSWRCVGTACSWRSEAGLAAGGAGLLVRPVAQDPQRGDLKTALKQDSLRDLRQALHGCLAGSGCRVTTTCVTRLGR